MKKLRIVPKLHCSLYPVLAGIALSTLSMIAPAFIHSARAADFFDDFNDGDDVGWTHWAQNSPNSTLTVENGGYVLRADDPVGLGVTVSLRTGITLSNFFLSMDVLNWKKEGAFAGDIALVARASLSPVRAYWAGFTPNSRDNASLARLTIVKNAGGGVALVPGALADFTIDPAKAYRLVFTGQGSHLEARLYALDNLNQPVASLSAEDTALQSGIVGIQGHDTFAAANLGHGPVDFTVDNFYASTPDDPALAIEPAVLLSWPLKGAGFTLEGASDVTGPWTTLNVPASMADGKYTVAVKTAEQQKFYRLRRP